MTSIRRFLSRICALVAIAAIALTGCANAGGLTGNYQEDTLTMVNAMREAIELPQDAPNRVEMQAQTKELINAYAARYRRDGSVGKLNSFTTVRTAINSLAGHYNSAPNRPIPKKLKDRLSSELRKVEAALKRGY